MRKIKAAIHITICIILSCSCTNAPRVYICTGPYSKAYHKTEECRGLRRCSGKIECVSEKTAKEIGRHKCGWCY